MNIILLGKSLVILTILDLGKSESTWLQNFFIEVTQDMGYSNIMFYDNDQDQALHFADNAFEQMVTFGYYHKNLSYEIANSEYQVLIVQQSPSLEEINLLFQTVDFTRVALFIPKDLQQYLQPSFLRLDSLVFIYDIQETQVHLTEIYSILKESLFVNNVLVWEVSGGVSMKSDFIWHRRTNFRGLQIRNAIMRLPKHLQYYEAIDNNGKLKNGQGMFVELMDILSETMNFTTKYVESVDGKFGGLNEDGTWNGMVGMLVSETADVLCGPLAVTLIRSEVIDYTISVMFSRSVLVMKKRGTMAMNFWAYLDVFTHASKVMLVVTMMILASALALKSKGAKDKQSWLENIGHVCVLFIQRDSNFKKDSAATNLLFLTVSLTGYLVFAYFSGMTTSLMTTGTLPPRIKSFSDIIPNDLQVIVWKGTTQHNTMQYSRPGTAMREVYDKTMRDNPKALFDTLSEAQAEVDKDDNKKVAQFTTGLTEVKSNQIKIRLDDANLGQGAIGLQKNSELREVFNYIIAKLTNNGVLRKLHDKFIRGPIQLPDPEQAHTLGIENVLFAFLIISLGVACGCILVVLEHFSNFSKSMEI